ncbi:pentapeptide repeat-containing protein [Nocardia fluminea]|uniref:pentapeptide repeat-containing protein n=1 Tax=Nocardia fluminea TaxID=134984 RepID=UPI0036700FA4
MPTSDLTGLSQPDSVLAAGVLALGAALLAFIGVMATRRQTGRHFAATHELDQIKALRERYTTCAEQLAHDDPAVRTAGVYGLGALGDDWFARAVTQKRTLLTRLRRVAPQRAQFYADTQHGQEVQVCVELLCAYLRSSIRASADSGPRGAVVAVLGKRSRRWRPMELVFDLRAADLNHAELNSAELNSANLSGANLGGADLSGADLGGADLLDADLNGANLSGANLRGANLRGANLGVADLSGADLSGADLLGADLHGAGLRGMDLSGMGLLGADLRGADLNGANLSHATLSGADLFGANLGGANLLDANLLDANLVNAYLVNAYLCAAYLGDANLTGADLGGADLSGADLSGADLSGVDLRGVDLSGIHHDKHTQWPKGFSPPLPTLETA